LSDGLTSWPTLRDRVGPSQEPDANDRQVRTFGANLTGWVARERDTSDRRAVAVRALPDRTAELFRLYAGMNTSMDQILAGYTDTELKLIADFLGRTTDAGRDATDELAAD
jgi:hypothetical protein